MLYKQVLVGLSSGGCIQRAKEGPLLCPASRGESYQKVGTLIHTFDTLLIHWTEQESTNQVSH